MNKKDELIELLKANKKDSGNFNEYGEYDPNPYWLADEIVKLCNIPLVMESQFEAYAAFCIECDRQGMKPIKYKDYLEIG